MDREKGFSLLEILVAFSILAISLGILLKIFSSGVNTAAISEDYIVSTQIAQSLMARTGVEAPLAIGETTGIEEDKYHWRVTIENYINPLTEEDEGSTVELMVVTIVVTWGEQLNNRRSVELNTVKTGQNKNAI